MKKLLALLFLSFTIACSAWAEKYEYVRLTEVSKTIELQNGDIAWFVNSDDPFSTYIMQYDLDGTELSKQTRLNSSAVGGQSSTGSTFVGPCILGTRYDGEFVTLKILRTSESGYKTLEWDGSKYAGTTINNSNSSSGVVDPTNIQYDELFGWAYFTDSNWVYSYTNLSWYYMHSIDGDIYVWNANLPDSGWTKWTRS
jgi:hypothetical protein